MEDFCYDCDILANAYNLSPMGKYEIKHDWDYSLLEDSQETFSQMMAGVSQGVITKPELRNWLKPSETMEESEKAVAEIEEAMPSIEELFNEEKKGGKVKE